MFTSVCLNFSPWIPLGRSPLNVKPKKFPRQGGMLYHLAKCFESRLLYETLQNPCSKSWFHVKRKKSTQWHTNWFLILESWNGQRTMDSTTSSISASYLGILHHALSWLGRSSNWEYGNKMHNGTAAASSGLLGPVVSRFIMYSSGWNLNYISGI